MTYILSGINISVPARASRPREPKRPAPSKVVSSPEMAARLLRPRSLKSPGNPAAHLVALKNAKLQQKQAERGIKALQAKLSVTKDAPTRTAIKRQIDVCIKQVRDFSAVANREALAAIDKGASESSVKDVSSAASEGSVTPVVESSTAALQEDGSVALGPDAAIVDVPVTSDPGSATIPGAPAPVSDGLIFGVKPLYALAGAGIGLFALSRLMK
jgi:hypothetical protein